MQIRTITVLALAFIAILPLPAVASTTEAQAIPGVANETPQARQLAMERWEFVKRLGREINFSIWSYTFADYTALFPIGRSDRVYLLCLGPYSNEPNDHEVQDYPTNEILCYQRKKGRDKLVYKLPIIHVLSPATKGYPPKSLLEYITSHGMGESYVNGNQSISADGSLAIQAPISIYEYNDLSAQGDYVEYKDDWGIDCLDIYLLSDLKSQVPDKKEELGLGEDTFKKYGLPVIKEEEAVMGGKT